MLKINSKLLNKIFSLMMLVSSFVVIQFSGKTIFLLLQILFCIITFLFDFKIHFFKKNIINLIYINFFISIISAFSSDMWFSYKKAALVMVVFLIPGYFAASFINNNKSTTLKFTKLLINSLKIMCIIQLVWILLQFALYKSFSIDLNKMLFTDILHIIKKASFYRSGMYYPSGLSWHSAILAPMFVIAFTIFKNPYIRILIIVDAMLCGNTTSLLGVILCAAILFYYSRKGKKITIPTKIRNRIFILCISLAITGVCVLLFTNIGAELIKRVEYIIFRFTDMESDDSTSAHVAYYTDCIKIIKNSPLFQVLFGYGYGCSGYPISVMYNRYASWGNWAIECDIVDIIISRGIIGFICYYLFLIRIVVKGVKIDPRYVAIMIPIIIEGFGYNVQWDYIFFIEMFMYIAINKQINIFEFCDAPKNKLTYKKILSFIKNNEITVSED